jgi:hypothetical protein
VPETGAKTKPVTLGNWEKFTSIMTDFFEYERISENILPEYIEAANKGRMTAKSILSGKECSEEYTNPECGAFFTAQLIKTIGANISDYNFLNPCIVQNVVEIYNSRRLIGIRLPSEEDAKNIESIVQYSKSFIKNGVHSQK